MGAHENDAAVHQLGAHNSPAAGQPASNRVGRRKCLTDRCTAATNSVRTCLFLEQFAANLLQIAQVHEIPFKPLSRKVPRRPG